MCALLIILITSYLCSNIISKIIRLSNHMIKIWLCFEQQTWKYFALGHDAQTTQPSVCRSWPYAKYLSVWSAHSVNSHISSFRWNPKPFAKILWSLTQPLYFSSKYHVLKFHLIFLPLINIKTTYLDTLNNSLKMSIILKHGSQTRTITSCFLLNFTIDERSMLQQKLEVKIMYFPQI